MSAHENCPFAFRRPGEKSIHCRKVEAQGQKYTYCGHQYFCKVSKRWEATKQVKECPLR